MKKGQCNVLLQNEQYYDVYSVMSKYHTRQSIVPARHQKVRHLQQKPLQGGGVLYEKD